MYVSNDNYIDNCSCYTNKESSQTLVNNDNINLNIIKRELLSNGKYEIYKYVRYAEYSKYCVENFGTELNHKYEKYLGVDLNLTPIEEKCCQQLYESHRKKVKRLKNKLWYWIENYDCLWLTLTFRDDVLNNTSEKTRRTYISRFLSSLNIPFYVANIDYGDKEKNNNSLEREHYHAIIQSDYLDMSLYQYGFIYVEKIHCDTNSVTRISKYINKLTYHAYKDSTGGNRLIYSRKRVKYDNSDILIPWHDDTLPF